MTEPWRRGGRPLWRDPRVLLGLGVTAATLWLAFRGVDFRVLTRDFARANLVMLVGLSVPLYALQYAIRALRWRHLTAVVCPVPFPALARGIAVGFLANNVFPLRVGELARAWFVSREVGAPLAALFGTVILDRVLDAVVIVGLGIALLGFGGREFGEGSRLAVGVPLLLSAAVPLALVMVLRWAPERAIPFAERIAAWFLPARWAAVLARLLRRIAQGLGSLQGGTHLFWIAWHSTLLWIVLGALPFLIGFAALGVEFPSLGDALRAGYVTLVAVAVAVAVPSAPGFFGPYHLACREALSRFGVPEESALALGTLVHAVFWLTTLGLGVLALRGRAARWRELAEPAASAPEAGSSGKASPPARR